MCPYNFSSDMSKNNYQYVLLERGIFIDSANSANNEVPASIRRIVGNNRSVFYVHNTSDMDIVEFVKKVSDMEISEYVLVKLDMRNRQATILLVKKRNYFQSLNPEFFSENRKVLQDSTLEKFNRLLEWRYSLE